MIRCLDCNEPMSSIEDENKVVLVGGWQRVWYEKIDDYTSKKMMGYVCEKCHDKK